MGVHSLPSHASVTHYALDIHRWGHLLKPVRLTIVDTEGLGDEGGPVKETASQLRLYNPCCGWQAQSLS